MGKRGRWIDFGGAEFAAFSRRRDERVASGDALKSHCLSAHHGEFDPSCPACVEIKKKMLACIHK